MDADDDLIVFENVRLVTQGALVPIYEIDGVRHGIPEAYVYATSTASATARGALVLRRSDARRLGLAA